MQNPVDIHFDTELTTEFVELYVSSEQAYSRIY